MQVDSVITNIYGEQGIGKASGKPFTKWFMDLEDGTKVCAGFRKPASYTVGQRLSANIEKNQWGDWEIKAASAGGATAPAQQSGGFKPGASGRPFPVPKTSGEVAIIRQNALTNANALVSTMAVLDHPSLEIHGGDLAELVIEIAYKFAEFSTGQREVKHVEEMKKGNT